MRSLVVAAALMCGSVPAARARPTRVARARAERPEVVECLAALDRLGVAYRRASRPGIDIGVEVEGPVGGVEYRSFTADPLVLDCSLVYSLARAGELFRAFEVGRLTFSSAYQRRTIRGTNRPSRHSFGLAIDVHTFARAGGRDPIATVRADYEQGLGDRWDCAGGALTEAGAILRALVCQLVGSGLFRVVLTPDFDADHYNHFHLEARPWRERTDRDPAAPLDAAWDALDRRAPPDI